MAEGKIQKIPNFVVYGKRIKSEGTYTSRSEEVQSDVHAGYTPIGIVGFIEHTSTKAYFYGMRFVNNKINISWSTVDGSSITGHECTVYVLYVSS